MAGRPKLQIDPEQVRKLAQIGCSLREIGAVLGCDEATIRRRFAAELELGDARGKIAIRRQQLKRAMEGSDKLLIHLGMARLDQKLKADITSDDKPFGYFERAENARDKALPTPPETT